MGKIKYVLPKRIYENAEERFVDNKTGHIIALNPTLAIKGKKQLFLGKNRLETLDSKGVNIQKGL